VVDVEGGVSEGVWLLFGSGFGNVVVGGGSGSGSGGREVGLLFGSCGCRFEVFETKIGLIDRWVGVGVGVGGGGGVGGGIWSRRGNRRG